MSIDSVVIFQITRDIKKAPLSGLSMAFCLQGSNANAANIPSCNQSQPDTDWKPESGTDSSLCRLPKLPIIAGCSPAVSSPSDAPLKPNVLDSAQVHIYFRLLGRHY